VLIVLIELIVAGYRSTAGRSRFLRAEKCQQLEFLLGWIPP
jgi:hypothetical protein